MSVAPLRLLLALALAGTLPAHADALLDWNQRSAELATAAKLPPPLTYRATAIVQVAVLRAVNAITGRSHGPRHHAGARGASVDAAVAAANRAVLLALVPSQQAAIEQAYQEALALLPPGPSTTAGLAVGEAAAAEVLAERERDGSSQPDEYRPVTAPGVYTPTVTPVLPFWGQRRPWHLSAGHQFRPGPPPALTSETWARDLEELRGLGARTSTRRTPAQTEVARFWETTSPVVYFPLARQLAAQPGREVAENARLLAAVATALDDALVAVFDAKYAYTFWRPLTAIRNADRDGNPASVREPGWLPLLDTPMHPEYPCAHCTVAGALAAVLEAEVGRGPAPRWASTSPSAPGVVHRWETLDELTDEVALARICGGVHYRHSTEVGTALGRRVGQAAVAGMRDGGVDR